MLEKLKSDFRLKVKQYQKLIRENKVTSQDIREIKEEYLYRLYQEMKKKLKQRIKKILKYGIHKFLYEKFILFSLLTMKFIVESLIFINEKVSKFISQKRRKVTS